MQLTDEDHAAIALAIPEGTAHGAYLRYSVNHQDTLDIAYQNVYRAGLRAGMERAAVLCHNHYLLGYGFSDHHAAMIRAAAKE